MKRLIYILLFVLPIGGFSQGFLLNPYAYGGVAADLLLDSFPGAAAAYSLRKLDKDYTGNCIRVRRSSDNAERNIGFVGNYCDTTNLKTFCSGTNGFLVTWHDQSDSAKHVSQSTAALQPQIVSSGTLITEGGKVAINGASSALNNLNLVYTTNTLFAIAVAKTTGTNTDQSIASQNSGGVGRSNVIAFGTSGTKLSYVFNNGASYVNSCSETLTVGTRYLLTNYSFSNNYYSAVNGGTGNNVISGQAFTPISSLGFSLFRQPNGFNSLTGNIQEVIIWNSDQNTNKAAIELNINSFYAIY